MLKALNKINQKKCSNVVLAAKRNVTTGKLHLRQDIADRRQSRLMDVQVTQKSGLGIVRLNREHRNNMLTPNYITQVKRGVESMYIDHSVELIYLTTAKAEHFSNGTDFRTIMHYKANNEKEKAAAYLGQVFDLQATFAKINKPLMTVAPGNSLNSGAGLVAASGLPYICYGSMLAFNEVQFGFVPHAGSCYYASRLPGDIGTFLTLTGFPISGQDAVDLKMADGHVGHMNDHEHHMADVVYAMDQSNLLTPQQMRNADTFGATEQKFTEEYALEYRDSLYNTDAAYEAEYRRRNFDHLHGAPFVDPKKRKPDVVAEADIAYERMLRAHSEATHGLGGAGYYEHTAAHMNVFRDNYSHFTMHAGGDYEQNPKQRLQQHRELIDRCFYANTIEEIVDNLKRETHPFAKEALKRMDNNSMLSMKIALKMLRRAKNLPYGEILRMELNASLNKINDSDFEKGVTGVLLTAKENHVYPGFDRNVSDARAEAYLQENPLASQIDLDIVDNSLLPTRHFFEEYTDSLRVYINETSSPQARVREAVELEINDVLRKAGINALDKTMNVPMAREYIQKKIKRENYEGEFFRRSMHMVRDKKLRRNYYDKLDTELAALEADQDRFYELVNGNVAAIFEDAYLKRLQTIMDKSKEANGLDKRRMFLRLKKFLIKSRILQFQQHETEKATERIMNMPYKAMHIQQDFDKGLRDVEHPMIQQSVMWHLSEVVGKANLSPEVMMKTYLTDPESAKEMTSYVFDKEALQKLQRDLLENPEKYEKLLVQDHSTEKWEKGSSDYGRFFELKAAQQANIEYKYGYMNDGRTRKRHLDAENWAERTEYLHYKDWQDEIKHKALDSLKMVVSRLLLDFQKSRLLQNSVLDFGKGEEETKTAALRRLASVLNEESSGEPENLRTKGVSDSPISTHFNDFIKSDQHLSKLFGVQPEWKGENQLVKGFRDEILSDLQSLVEIVLLQKHGEDIGEAELVKRLSALQNAANKGNTAGLNLIDDVLIKKTSQNAIQNAIEVVKPYFLNMVTQRLNEESVRLLTGFRFQENKMDTLTHFMAFSAYPDMLNAPAVLKINTYHPYRQALIDQDREHPLESTQFERRKILGDMNVSADVDRLAAITTQEDQLLENTRHQLEQLYQHDELQETREQMIDEAIKGTEADDFHELYAAAKKHHGSETEAELTLYLKNVETVADKVKNLEHEVDTLFTNLDWLRIYQKAIKDQGMDLDSVICATRDFETCPEDAEGTYYDDQIDNLNRQYQVEGKDWNDYAEYSGFLAGLHEAQLDLSKKGNANEQVNNMVKFLTLSDSNKSDSTERQMLFQSFEYEHLNANRMQKEIKTMSDISDRKLEQMKLVKTVSGLLESAPEDVKHQATDILALGSENIKLRSLVTYLEAGDFDKPFNAHSFFNNLKFKTDLMKDGGCETFFKNFGDTGVDVISLQELKSSIGTTTLSDLQKSQVQMLITNIDDQLSRVSNERRSEISLNEFMTKYNYASSDSLRGYSNDALKNIIQGALTKKSKAGSKMISEDTTHPGAHLEDHTEKSVKERALEVSTGGEYENTSQTGTNVQKQVFRQARTSLELSSEMKQVRNLYENKLLMAYSESNFDEEKVQSIIQEYTQARINDAMITPDFAKGASGPDRDIFMRMLRDQIIEELKLTDSMIVDDFAFEDTIHSHFGPNILEHKGEFVYGLGHLNNEEAIGYNKLKERAADIDNNRTIAHDNVFDQLLADYFLQQRGDVKKGNQLLQDLQSKFTQSQQDEPLNPHVKTAEPSQYKTLGEHYNRMTYNKDDRPELVQSNLPALMELDMALNRQLHNKKGFLSAELRGLDDEELEIPEWFPINDVRKPAHVYVEDSLREIMDELFEGRARVEKYMSRNELVAYDEVLMEYLRHKNLMPKLKREIYKDFNQFEQQNQTFNHHVDSQTSRDKQLMKKRSIQEDFNKDVKDEDSYFKWLAYNGSLEKHRRENLKEAYDDPTIYANFESFDTFYSEHLLEQAKLPPRKIDEEALKPKTPQDIEKQGHLYDQEGKQEKFFKDHQSFKEGKLEQKERIELFYVLEQMNKQAHEKSDTEKIGDANQHLKEYFGNSKNTFFYERNKIN